MSLAVASSMTWWFLRPLIAANMPRIMRGSAPCSWVAGSGDVGDGRWGDAGGTADGQRRDAVRGGGDTLDLAGLERLAVDVDVGDRAADQGDRVGRGERLRDLRV